MENLVWKGYLKFQGKGPGNELIWTRRYYVLYGQSERNQGRLDWYTTEEDYKQEISVRKTLYLESVKTVMPIRGEANRFQVNMKNSDVPAMMLAADNAESCQSWMSKIETYAREAAILTAKSAQLRETGCSPDEEEIYEPPAMAQKFLIKIVETDASNRCNLVGKYNLVVSAHHLSLQEIASANTLYTWPYRLIRRYGKSTSQFNLEAGRKCDSGAGLFNFASDVSNNIFASVQHMTQAMKENVHSPTTPQRNQPTLPVRSYDQNYITARLPIKKTGTAEKDKAKKPQHPPKPPLTRTASGTDHKSTEYVNTDQTPDYFDCDNADDMYATIEGAESQYSEVTANRPKAYADSSSPYVEPEDDPANHVSMTQIAAQLARKRQETSDSTLYDHISLQKSPEHRGKLMTTADASHLYGSIAHDTHQAELYSEIQGTGKKK